MQTEFERAKAHLDEVHEAVRDYPGEGVIFDALASFEGDMLERLIGAPAASVGDLRTKIAMYFECNGRPFSATEHILETLGEDLDRLFPEHAPKPTTSKRKRKAKTDRKGKGK